MAVREGEEHGTPRRRTPPASPEALPPELGDVLAAVADGITAQDPSGAVVFANDAAARLIGLHSAAELLAAPLGDVVTRFEILDEERRPLPLDELPGRVALRGEACERLLCYRVPATGEERWSLVSSRPVLGDDGEVRLAINTIHDVTGRMRAAEHVRLLGETSALLAASLDFAETLARVGELLLPAVADYCIVDLVEDGEGFRQALLRHVRPDGEEALRLLRERFPPERNPRHPVARVVAEREAVLVEDVDSAALEWLAQDDEELGLYRRLGAASYLVVPCVARGRIVGSLSLGVGPERRRYGAEDVDFAKVVGGRIALAFDNARLYREASDSYALLDTLLLSAPVGIGFWDRELRFVRLNEALASLNARPLEEHLGRTLGEIVPALAHDLEPLYRRVLESGEPLTHEEVRGDGPADRRHWISSYYPVRGEAGDITGVGAVIMEVTAQRRADQRLRLLAGAGELLSSTLDREELFDRVAHLVVPRFADSCNIYLADADVLRRVGYAHADPEVEQLVGSLPASYPLGEGSTAVMARVFARGTALLIPTVTPEFVDNLSRLGVQRGTFARIGTSSMMFVPLVARGEPLGVMSIGSRVPGRFDEADLELARELGRRAAVAIDNARLFGETTRLVDELRSAEARLRAALSAAAVSTWDWDVEADLVRGDDSLARLFGVEPAEASAGLPLGVFVDAIHADDRARVQSAIEHALETGEEYELEYRVTDAEGRPRWALARGRVEHDADGRPLRFLGALADLTERKQAERELERLATAAQALHFVRDGVFLLDGAGVVRLWNPAAARITGVPESEVLGRPAAEVLAGWALDQVGERGQTLPIEVGDRELWLSLTASQFPQGTVYAFRDLTDERALERLKSDFVSTVSHELRTPLAAIYGAAMTLARRDVTLADEQRALMLDVVSGESERLARIVNDILLASGLDSGTVDVSIERVDPRQVAALVLAAAEAHLPGGIELALDAPEGLPAVAADAAKVRQVLANLVENAIKYSPDGGPVTVSIRPGPRRVSFAVVDRGLGIPAAEHERIFEKFYRLDPNLTRGVGGTGLGLYISREIVRRMDGRIWVESEPGVGSTFTFELPLAEG